MSARAKGRFGGWWTAWHEGEQVRGQRKDRKGCRGGCKRRQEGPASQLSKGAGKPLQGRTKKALRGASGAEEADGSSQRAKKRKVEQVAAGLLLSPEDEQECLAGKEDKGEPSEATAAPGVRKEDEE